MALPALGVEVIVRRCSDGSPLPVITTPGGKQFVISEEGLEYEIAIKTGPTFPTNFSDDYTFGADLKVDDLGVGYWKTGLRPNHTTAFDGFCVSASDYGPTTYRRFKFALADASQDRGPQVTDPEQIKAGRITVTFGEYIKLGQRMTPVNPGSTGGSQDIGHLPEGKKFFLAPSLKTDKGQTDVKTTSWGKFDWNRVRVLGVAELRYETAATLMLRGHLDKNKPEHRALLRSSRDPTVRALQGDLDDEDEDEGDSSRRRRARAGRGGVGASGSAAPPIPGVKREKGIKRERGAGGRVKPEPGIGGGSVYLDLTKPPEVPLKVGGKQVQADEIAVCDLLDSDGEEGEAPKWQVKKKQALEVEGGAGA